MTDDVPDVTEPDKDNSEIVEKHDNVQQLDGKIISMRENENLPEGWSGASPPCPVMGEKESLPEGWSGQQIPTLCGHRPPRPPAEGREPVRRVVRRDSRLEAAATLPSFSAPNCRSLGPKLNNVIEDMKMRELAVALCSETWEKADSKDFQREVERLFEIEGMKMVSEPRKYKRGGGVCILADLTQVSIQPLNVPNPDNLEIVFALIKPRKPGTIKEIITFAFYSPPRSRKKSKLIDHLVATLHGLMTAYPRAGVMGGGDRNCLDISPILAAVPRLRNIQPLPTHGGRNLDVLLTTMAPFYSAPVIIQPVGTDIPGHGVPSDHLVPAVYPVNNVTIAQTKTYTCKTTRPLPDSAVNKFGMMILEEDWKEVKEDETAEEQEEMLQKILTTYLEKTCPTQTVKLGPTDKPFITKELKRIDRNRKREYNRNNKSALYCQLNNEFKTKYEQEAKRYLRMNVDELREANPGQAYKTLKRLGAQAGDCPEAGGFTLSSHQGLTAAESASRLAQHFSSISQEFAPLELEELPIEVRNKIKSRKESEVPYISRQMVEKKIKEAKKTKGGVPDDLPTKLAKEFGPELARPAAQIFRTVAQTGKWPKRWKTERGIPLQKTTNPETEDDTRIISLTPFLSKIFEKFVVEWLSKYISDKIDVNQYGGRKGSSTSHYLIDFVSFILYNQDLKDARAVVAAMVDFKKAFNRQDHATLITILAEDMEVPGWLLYIIMGFLSERELVVAYQGEQSEAMKMPGGGPQGTVLGMLLFLVLINKAGFAEADRTMGTRITTAPSVRSAVKNLHLKYVDDLTLLESISLKDALIVDTSKHWDRPLNFHERTEHTLNPDQCQLQAELNKLSNYATTNKMKINEAKTKIMLFNNSKKKDFQPEILLEGKKLEVVEQMKLLGVIITSDLKWHENTKHITKKAYGRLWLLKRLKAMGASTETLLDVYCKQVRSVLEFAAVVWSSGITQENTTQIERVQKSAFSVILGVQYRSYEDACEKLSMETLYNRREKLALHFANSAVNHPVHNSWFMENDTSRNTRSDKQAFKPAQARTNRFLKSAIPYLTNLLNQ